MTITRQPRKSAKEIASRFFSFLFLSVTLGTVFSFYAVKWIPHSHFAQKLKQHEIEIVSHQSDLVFVSESQLTGVNSKP